MKPFLTLEKTLTIITLIISGTTILQAHINPVNAEPTTIYVPSDYTRIQWAIGNATAGDTIIVHSGTYHEHLNINKPLTLLGENKQNTIIDGSRDNRTITGIMGIIEITASDVVISGFTVQNNSLLVGIKVSGQFCNITDNIITQTNKGIFVMSQKTRIEKNKVSKNGQGIVLYSSSKVIIEENNATANTYGISIDYSFSNIIIQNKVTNSTEGGHGITLSNSYNNTIKENQLVSNSHGMWPSNSPNNTIVNNTIANNKLLGIELSSSSNNLFYHNNFVNNTKHIVTDTASTNTWDNGYSTGGNYWHDYTSIDQKSGPNQDQPGSDQIWDTPYNINDNNRDNYPSVNPYSDITSLIPDADTLTAHAGSDQTAKVNMAVYFNGGASTGNIITYEWNFGDQTSGTGITCSHTYSETGTYTVILTVRDNEGNSDTDQLIVTVTEDNNENNQPALIDTSSIWVSALAVTIIVVMLTAVIWKRKARGKRKRRR